MNELYVEKNGIKLNNQWVVAQNLYLCVCAFIMELLSRRR